MPATYGAVFAKPLAGRVPRREALGAPGGEQESQPQSAASEGSCLKKAAPFLFVFLAGVRADGPRPNFQAQRQRVRSEHGNAPRAWEFSGASAFSQFRRLVCLDYLFKIKENLFQYSLAKAEKLYISLTLHLTPQFC